VPAGAREKKKQSERELSFDAFSFSFFSFRTFLSSPIEEGSAKIVGALRSAPLR
jgi:hypothetical protein